MRLPALLLSLIPPMLASAPATALAQLDCNNAMTQADINPCAALGLQQATDEINATYTDFRQRLPRDKQEQLRQVQLARIAFKDKNCQIETSFADGGSMQPLLRDSCLAELTKHRHKQWQALRQTGDQITRAMMRTASSGNGHSTCVLDVGWRG